MAAARRPPLPFDARFDERLGEPLSWSEYTKNTFIELHAGAGDGREEEPAALRRQRSAPAAALSPPRSLRHAAIEEVALVRSEYFAAVAAMHRAGRRQVVPGSRGRSTRRARMQRAGHSRRGSSSSCSGKSSEHGSRWSSGRSSGQGSRHRAELVAAPGRLHLAVVLGAGQRGTPARLTSQHLSRASSSESSHTGSVLSGQTGRAAAGHAGAPAAGQRGTPARLPAQALGEESSGTSTPSERQLAEADAGWSADLTPEAGVAAPRLGSCAAAAAQFSVNVSNRFIALQAQAPPCLPEEESGVAEDEPAWPAAREGSDEGAVPSQAAQPPPAQAQTVGRLEAEGPCRASKRGRRRKQCQNGRREGQKKPQGSPQQEEAAPGAPGEPEERSITAADVLQQVQGRLLEAFGDAGGAAAADSASGAAAAAADASGAGAAASAGVERLNGAQADRLALFTARLHARAIAGHVKATKQARLLVAVPVEPCTRRAPDVLCLQLGAAVACEAADAAGWGFGTVIAPRSLAGQRGCFPCELLRPVLAEAQQPRPGAEHLDFKPGSWEDAAAAEERSGAQQRLRRKALLGRMRVARAALEAGGGARGGR